MLSNQTYMLQDHWRPHDGRFFCIVRFLDEYYYQKSISTEALWARIYMTLSDTRTLFLIERCRTNLIPKGCDVEKLDAISTFVAQSAGQPEKVLEMFDNWSAPIAPRQWETLDNKRRLERLSGSQSACVDDVTLDASHSPLANQPAHHGNVTLSQHLAETTNNFQVTSSTITRQPLQTDHLDAAQQGIHSFVDSLDPQLRESDLESIMSRDEAPVCKSAWKKIPMELPAPFPNFPISDVSSVVERKASTIKFTHTNTRSQVRNEGNGKQSMGSPPPRQQLDSPYVEPLHKPVEAPDAQIEPLRPVRAPEFSGLSPQKQAELVYQQLLAHGERQKAREGKYRGVADELKKG